MLMSGEMPRTYWHSPHIERGYPEHDGEVETRTKVHEGDPRANLVSSLLADGQHAPAIDLDLPCKLINSSTLGHHHLLIEHRLSWWQYRLLLRAMVFVGLVERSYYRHSVRRRMTMLRLPGFHKGEDRRDGLPSFHEPFHEHH